MTALCVILSLMLAGIIAWLIVLTVMIADNDNEAFSMHIKDKIENTDMVLEVYKKMNDMEERINKKISSAKKRK